MKITPKDIAEKLQLSRVTVTKALQDHQGIPLDTRKKVKAMAEALGYIPNSIGRSLSTQKTLTLGIIVPQINHSFFSSVIEEVYAKAADLGYQIILMVSHEDEAKELAHVKTLLPMNVDGLVIDTASSTSSSLAFDLIEKHQIPFLFFDRKYVESKFPGGYFDDYLLSYQLTLELLKKGLKFLPEVTL
ncbi:MAG: LacI family DNA-binding transcriptional regulator [Bacteroidota bacterium]